MIKQAFRFVNEADHIRCPQGGLAVTVCDEDNKEGLALQRLLDSDSLSSRRPCFERLKTCECRDDVTLTVDQLRDSDFHAELRGRDGGMARVRQNFLATVEQLLDRVAVGLL